MICMYVYFIKIYSNIINRHFLNHELFIIFNIKHLFKKLKLSLWDTFKYKTFGYIIIKIENFSFSNRRYMLNIINHSCVKHFLFTVFKDYRKKNVDSIIVYKNVVCARPLIFAQLHRFYFLWNRYSMTSYFTI